MSKSTEQLSLTLAPLNQLSIMLSLFNEAHSNVISFGHDNTGSVVSSIVNLADVLLLLPHASVAVNTTSTNDVDPHTLVNPPV